MDRDEYLAQEVTQWKYRILAYWEPNLIDKDGDIYDEYVMLKTDWHPGKSWPQTGMLLETMKEDFQLRVQEEVTRHGKVHYYVAFIGTNEHYGMYGTATEIDFREAIATAAARARGWIDDESME